MKDRPMLFSVHALDAPDAPRAQHYDAHKAHLALAAAFDVRLVIGGPLKSPDGTAIVGSLMVFEAPDAASVERYHAADPFRVQGVWHTSHIALFDRRT